MICRSHAFCASQEWYIIIGRCVIACSGKSSATLRAPSAVACSRAPSSGWIPERQRIEIGREPRAVRGERRLRPVVESLSGEAKILQRLGVHLQHDLHRGRAEQRVLLGELEVVLVGVAVVAHVLRPSVREERLVLDVLFPLLRIRRAAQRRLTVRPAPAREEADAREFLVVDDEVAVVGELARAVVARERGKFQPRGELDEHVLPRPHVAIRRENRMADRIGRGVGLGDRPVEQRDRVVALEIGGVRQHQVGELHGFGLERVDDHEERNRVLAAAIADPCARACRAPRRCSCSSSTPCWP